MRTTPVTTATAVTTAAALLAAGAAVLGAPGAASASAPSTATASVTAPALAAPAPAASAMPITFAPGTTSADVGGDLAAGAVQTLTFTARAGQDATVRFRSGSGTEQWVLMAPDGTPLHTRSTEQQADWSGRLPATGTYALQVLSTTGGSWDLHLDVAVRLRFPVGGTATAVRGSVDALTQRRYTFDARGGQRAAVAFRAGSPEATWTLVAPDGTPLHTDHTAAQRGTTRVVLPATGTYRLDVTSATATAYHLGLSIPR